MMISTNTTTVTGAVFWRKELTSGAECNLVGGAAEAAEGAAMSCVVLTSATRARVVLKRQSVHLTRECMPSHSHVSFPYSSFAKETEDKTTEETISALYA
jgi:hypothetical protein